MSFRILSLDGGGIRGLLTTVVLERLERKIPGWIDRADLLAGTSTGALIALGLAKGMNASEIRGLYERHGAAIFRPAWRDNLQDLGRLAGATYDNRPLRRLLRDRFGDLRLKDLRRRILVPAFALDNGAADPARRSWAAKFFHNVPGPDSDGSRLVRDVALYSCSAPAYFPSVDGFIDGGVVANNPALAALAQSQDDGLAGRVPAMGQVALLSLGTGRSLVRIEGDRLDWGIGQWARPILGILADGGIDVVDYQCRQFLGRRYHRLSPAFAPDDLIPMDAIDRMADLVRIAESVDLAPTVAWLRRSWLRR
jgi:predicted acylesterase/phospholipase RssA